MSRPQTTRNRRGLVVHPCEAEVLRPDQNTAAERRAASLTVAAHALDVADCRDLLDKLGLGAA